MARVIIPNKTEEGKSIPITQPCFIMYRGQYLTKDGTFTTDKKAALVAPTKGTAKEFVSKFAKTAKVVPLVKADYEELWPKEQPEATQEGGDSNEL